MSSLETHLLAQLEQSKDFFWHRLRWAAVKRWFPDRPFALLDVGAGAGLLGEYLREERPEVAYHFVEPLESLRESLTQRYGPERDASAQEHWRDVDVVTLLDVLEHQGDDYSFVAGLYARMPAGARLIITVPALKALWSDWDVKLGHQRRYDKRSLRQVLASQPFVVRELTYLFPEMLPAGVVRALRNQTAEGAEFPVLPGPVNKTLTALGRLSLEARKLAPLGTSLLAVVDKPW
ncbi:MAG: methyltransferase domain-containing protein [Archangiaceae bacterium]|nr:methyltransferase domain-containing protein [Archangiaceae bacterium]